MRLGGLHPGPMCKYTVPMARFWKMHGCGNDFVVFDERAGSLGLTAARAASIANRRTGVGCDQFIAIEPPPPGSNADAQVTTLGRWGLISSA